jgi:hypothetical protein
LKVLAPPSSPSSSNGSQAPAETRLANIFEALQLEELSPDSDTAKPASTNKTAKSPPPQEYEIDDSSTSDSLFAVLGFLKDYAEIEKMVMETWMHYKLGRLDLMAASVTTDTAYGIIKRSSEDLLSSLPGQKTYPDICDMLANAEFSEEGQEKGTVSAELAQYLALPTESLLSSFAALGFENKMPVYNGQFGHYNAAKNSPGSTPQEQHRQNMLLLVKYLPEITKLSRANMPFPVQDEMTAGLRAMMDANKGMNGCPMYAIFVTKLFLGIHRVLGVNHTDPFGELQTTATRCISTIDAWFGSLENKKLVHWPDSNNERLRQVKTFVQEWVQEDQIGKFQIKVAGRANFTKAKTVPFLFLKRNPIACGLLTLRVNFWLQEAGQTMIGTWGSVIYPIHLYNACRQSALLDVEWEDAEYIYQLHTSQRLFVGAPPKEPQDYLKRFLLMRGASVSNFARNQRPSGNKTLVDSKKGPRGLKTTSPVRDTFHARYVDTKNAVLSTANITAMISVANKAQRTHPPLADVEQLARDVSTQKQLSPIQLLACVREGVAVEEMALLFDYFGAHERGLQLLREVKEALHDDLAKHSGYSKTQDDSQLPFVVGYIFDLVAGGIRETEEKTLSDNDSRILYKVSDVVEAFLERDVTGAHGLLQARARTRAALFDVVNDRSDSVRIWDPQGTQNAQRGGR